SLLVIEGAAVDFDPEQRAVASLIATFHCRILLTLKHPGQWIFVGFNLFPVFVEGNPLPIGSCVLGVTNRVAEHRLDRLVAKDDTPLWGRGEDDPHRQAI